MMMVDYSSLTRILPPETRRNVVLPQRRFTRRSFATISTSSTSSITSSPPTTALLLHVETIGTKEKNKKENNTTKGDIAFLHGLLGHGRNLKTFAKQVCEVQQRTGHLIDLRGHGKSRLLFPPAEAPSGASSQSSPSSFEACVHDIVHTVASNQLSQPTTWVGHSWGGRMALQYVYEQQQTQANTTNTTGSRNAAATVDRLWLLDVVPGQANESVERVVGVVAQLQAESYAGSKKELVERLTSPSQDEGVGEGLDMATAQWLASSYNPKVPGDFGFDLQVVRDILPEFGTQDFEGMLTTVLEQGIRVDLVRGGKNRAWDITTLNRLESLAKQFPQHFGLHVLPKAGHWVHVDDLKGLVSLFAAAAVAEGRSG